MIRGENSDDSFPTDLIIEILSRLPAKSIARCRCVSKLWSYTLLRPDFTDLFLTRSSARPRLLFAVQREEDDWCFLSSPQPQNPYDEKKLSPVVAADFHMSFLGDKKSLDFCGHASGLICFRRETWISEDDKHPVICNPSTGQLASLPLRKGCWKSFSGFDPIDKQFKVLSINYNEKEEPYQILTLGTGNDSWRNIHCPINHFPSGRIESICINGVLYYLATEFDERAFLIVCFDVRSEKFSFIYKDFISYYKDKEKITLINYKGKLGVIAMEHDQYVCYPYTRRRSRKLCMRVIKDMEKPESEWSEYVYTFRENQAVGCNVATFLVNQVVDGSFFVDGVTATGDIVLSMFHINPFEPFYVIYINPERNTLQSVEIQGIGAAYHGAFEKPSRRSRRVRVFVDHVEDLKFITMQKTTTTRTKDDHINSIKSSRATRWFSASFR